MGKKFRRFYKSARGPLAWILSLILVLQMFPAQGMRYALADVMDAVSEEAVVDETTAGDEEVALVKETSGVKEGVTEGEPVVAPVAEGEGEVEGAPEGEPAPIEVPADITEGDSADDPTDPVVEPVDPAPDPDPEPATDPVPAEAPGTRGATENTWTVKFYNRDARVIQTSEITKGQEIGDAFPDVPFYEDHTGEWYVGTVDEYGKFTYLEGPIYSTYVPTEDVTIVPKYEVITFDVTFYQEDKTTVVATRTVDPDSNYGVGDMPAVPDKPGYAGRWAYSGGVFNNTVRVTEDTDVWAEYDQNVFNVTFKVDGDDYQTDTYFKGDKLTIPADPVVEGKEFIGWFIGETEYTGGETVNSDLTITAKFEDEYAVTFIVRTESGEVERLSQYFRTQGEPIGTMPQNPFVAGKVFEKWVIDGTDTVVTADTVVDESMTVVAVFRSIDIYDITAIYYYEGSNRRVEFNRDLLQVEGHEFPYTITAPASTKTDPNEVPGAPDYYPETPTVTLTADDFDAERNCTVEFKYVPYTAVYDFVYLLKDLDGNGYTEIDRTSNVEGVLNSYVTPTVKEFDYAVLELAEGATIETTGLDGQPKQELPVYYTRKNFQLTYETNGGSYVPGGTYAYGSTVNLPAAADNPIRDGYDFEGWYSDEALTQRVTGAVTVNADTTLYAKWTGKTVNYTIVYMIEEYDNATNTTSFVYDNSRNATGQVGTTVYASSAPDLTGNAYRGYERDTEWDQTSSVTIAADGSSVLIVHYKLIRYTLVFNLNRNTGRITMDGQTYSGSDYRITDVVLGQDVSSMWPATQSEVYASDRYFDGWTGAGSTYITKRYELIWDNVANANSNHEMTFTATWSSSSYNRNAEYWLQQPDGTYKVADEYTQIGLNTNNLGQKNIDGYSQHSGTPSGYQGSGNSITSVTQSNYGDYVRDDNRIGGNNRTYYEFEGHLYRERRWNGDGSLTRYNVTMTYTYRFYYDRAKYKIEYFFGNSLLDTKSDIYFEADISGSTYNYTPEKPANTATIDYSDYTWGGWYEDAAFQNPYTFDNMPGHNVALYAKWVAPEFEVDFVMDGGTPAVETQTVTKYDRAEKPANPTKDGYTFEGWFTSADGITLFDWNTQITADTTIYAHWTRDTLSYTVHYVDENGDTVAPDKTVSNPNFVIGQTVEEQAIAIAGYRPDQSSKSTVLAASSNEITFVYSAKAETTGYTVRYVIADGETGAGAVVAAEKKVENIPGTTASVIETAAAVDYAALYAAHPELDGVEFYPDEVEKTLVLTASEEQNVFTFFYSSYKNAKVTVNFVDMNGDPIPGVSADTQVFKVGKTFTLSRTPIAGWELYKAVEGTQLSDPAAGSDYKITQTVAEDGTLVFTLFYQKKVTITAASASRQYNGEALKLPEGAPATADGLLGTDELTSVEFDFTNTDNTTNDGRINAGTATATPKNAQISGNGATNPDYYKIRYISGTLEVTKINVTVRIEPDRWTGNVYNGTEYKTGFTNGSKTLDDYVMISHEGYKNEYQDDIWEAIKALPNVKEGGVGLGYYVVAQTDADDYEYVLGFDESMLPVNDNYSVNLFVRSGRLEILPAELTVTTGSAEKVYDGTPLTKDEASLSGVVAADQSKISVTATGTITDPGEEDNTYEINWGGVASSNYTITDDLGALKVTPAELKITVNDQVVKYNGSEQSGYTISGDITGTGSKITTDDYVVEGLANEDVLTVTYTPAKGTDAGTYENGAFGEIKVMRGDKDVTENYTITTDAGDLIIEKAKINITVTGDKKEFTYDGTPKTASGYVLSSTDTLYDPTKVVFSGASSTVTKTDAGTYPMGLAASQFSYNDENIEATFSVTDGELKINKATMTINVVGDKKTYTYDGQPHTASDFTATSESDLFDEGSIVFTGTASVTKTDAGTYPMGLAASQFSYNNANIDVTFKVTDGELKIDKADLVITITGNKVEETYDGTAKTAEGYTTTSESTLFDASKVVFTGTASVTKTDAGTYPMGLAASQFSYNDPNFETVTFNVTDGQLKINKKAVTVTITGNKDSKTYNGEEQKVEGYEVSISDPLYKETDFTFSGTKVAKGTDVGTYEMGLAESQFTNNNANFDVTFDVTDGELEITKLAVTVTITGHNAKNTYDAQAHTVTGYDFESSDPLYTESNVSFSGTASATRTDVGKTDMGLVESQFSNTNNNFDVTFSVTDGYQEIEKAKINITITGAKVEVTYDGNEHTAEGYTATSESPLFDAGKVAFTGTASVTETDAGTYPMGLAESQFSYSDENIDATFSVTDGELKINKATMTINIVGDKKTYTYDGTAKTAEGYTATSESTLFDAGKVAFTGTASVTKTDAGTYPMGLAASQFSYNDNNFENVTFKVTDGELKITEATMVIIITGNKVETDYDGNEHTAEGYTATSESTLFDASKVVFTGTASVTETDAGTYPMGLAESQFSYNDPNFTDVEFQITDGQLKINKINVTVTIVGKNNTTDYDGEEHSVEGYTATADNDLYDVTKDFTFTGTAEAARTDAGTTNMNLAESQFENTNPNFETVTFQITDGYQTINPIEVTVTIVGANNTTDYDGQAHTVNGYTATADTDLFDVTKDIVFNGTDTATRTDAGTTNMGLAADQFSSNNPNFSKVTFNVTDGYQKINPIDVTVTITGKNNTTDYDGAEHKVTGYDVEISNPLYTEADFDFNGTAEAKRTAAGTTNMNLASSQFENKNPNFGTVTFNVTDGYQEITPIDVTVTIVGHNATNDYDGQAHTVTGYDVETSTPLYTTADFEFVGAAEAARTDAGQTDMGLTSAQFSNTSNNFANVTFNVTDGYQKINPINVTVTITGRNNTATYDGEEHEVSGYDVEISNPLYKETDFEFSGTAVAKRTEVGQTDMGLKSEQFTNKNSNFATVTFNVTDGFQKIDPLDAVIVTITEHSDTVDYDGVAHTVTGYDVEISDPLYKETDFSFSGNDTVSGTNAGSYDMELKPEDFKNENDNFSNVTFVIVDGQLVIKPIDVTVTITGHNNTTDYDGAEHKVSGYDVEISNPLYTEADFEFSGTAEAARTDAGKTDMGLKPEQFTNKNGNFKTVTFEVTDGYQEIKPIDVTVTITEKGDEVNYDGKEHTVEGYTATADNDLYDVTKDFTFSGNDSVSGTNAGSYDMELKPTDFTNTNENFSNVTFVIVDGQLVIKPIDVTVTIIGKTSSVPYDGTEHTVEGYTATADNDLYDVTKDFTFSGTDEAARTDAGKTNMGLKAADFENTNPNFATVTFDVTDGYQEITPIDVTVTIVGNSNTTTYDGEEHKVTGYEVTNISSTLYTETDFEFSGNAEAARTEVGKTEMGLKPEQFENTNPNFANVTFNVTDGYQEIAPVDEVVVTIVGKNNTTTYDGEEHTVEGYTVEISNPLYTEDDFEFTGNATASRTDVGTTNMNLASDQFENLNENFAKVTFNVTDGYQTIEKKAVTVTITGNKDSKTYSGEEQKVEGYKVDISDPLYTEDDFTFGGEAIAKGTDVDTYPMGLAEDQFTNKNDNFDVTFKVTDGELEITKLAVTVTITGNTDTKPYNGEEQKVEGYKVDISDPLYTEDDFTFGGEAVAKGTDVDTYPMGLAEDQFTNKNDNFDVTFKVTDGQLEIKPIDVTVTIVGNNNTTTYDGEDHTVTGYEVTNISSDLYTEADFTFSGEATATRKYEGTTNMNLSAEQFTNTNKNFGPVTFNVTDGYQTITPVGEVTVTITEHSDTVTYDGEEHTVTGYDVTSISDPLYTVADFTFSGNATVSGTNAGTYDMELKPEDFTNTNANFAKVTFVIVDGELEISKKPITVTITGNTDSKVFNGEEQKVEGYTVGIVDELYSEDYITFSGEAIAKGTEVDTYPMGLAQSQFANTNDNFDVTFNVTDGSLEITKLAVTVTITGNKDSKTYNGEEQKVEGYKVEISDPLYTEDDFEFSGTDVAKGTDVDTYPMGLAVDQFENKNDNFDVTFTVIDGELEITKLAVTVTIVGHNATNDYDGEEHSISGYDATASSNLYKVSGDEPDFTFSGTAEAARTDAGQTDMGLKVEQFANDNDNFDVTFEVTDGFQKINPIDVTVTITGHNSSVTYDGEEHSVSGYDAEASNNLYDVDNDFTFSGTAEAARTEAGKTMMELATDQFENTNPNFKTVTFVVTDGYQEIVPIDEVVVTIVGASNSTDYDGEEHSVSGYTATASTDLYDVDNDFTFSGTAEAARTNAGKTEMGLAADQFENTNPNFAKVTFNVTDGYQEIVPISVTVTITGHNSSLPYDGTEHSVSGYDVQISNELYTENDFTFTGTAEAARTNAGKTPMGLTEDMFENNNDNFDNVTFVVTDGYQEITPIDVTVTITGHTDSKVFNGLEQSVTGYDVQISDPLYTVNDFVFTGTDVAKGTNVDTYPMGLSADQFENKNNNFANVTFNVTDGELEITKLAVTVTITGHTDSKVFNGQEQKVEGYEVEISDPLYTEDDFTFSGTDVAKGTDVGEYAMGLKSEQFTNNNDNFDITFEVTDGKLTITKKAVTVTITGNTDSKVYNREEQKVEGYEVSISDPLYTEDDFTFSGTDVAKGTDVGEYPMGLAVSQFANDNDNFDVTFNVTDGKLTITPVTDKVTVTITENSDEVTYDGKEHTVTGYTVSISNPLYTEADFTFSGTAEVKGTNAGTYPMELASSDFTNNNTNFSNVEFVIVDGQLKINPVTDQVTVTITEHSGEYTYDGTEKTVEGYDVTSISNELYTENDFTFSGTAEVKGTNAGTYDMGLAPSDFANTSTNFTNVVFEIVDGQLKINPKTIEDPDEPGTPDETHFTVEGPEDTIYNAKEQKQPVTVTDKDTGKKLEEGKDCTITYSDDVVNAGEVTVTVTGINNYTGEFKLTYNILPAPLTITTADDSKTYDATPLTNHNYAIEIVQNEGVIRIESSEELVTLLENDTLGIDITGSQTLVGSSGNVGELRWAEGKTNPILAAAIALRAAADPTAKQSNYDVTAKAGTLTVTDEDVPTELVVKKKHEDREYGLGETVTFELTATNIYDETRTITFIEIEGVEIEQAVWENVEPGATVTTTATYTVTEADILAGEFKNEVSVTIGDAEHGPYEDIVEIEDKNPHITVTKTVTSTATSYAAGDTIEYKIVVENDGNLTLTDVKVTDALTGDEWTVEELKPGDKKEFTAKYTVTEADANAGKVVNTATATGTDPEGNKPGVTPGTAETPITKPALPKTGDASSLFPAVVTAAMGLMSMAAGIRSRRRRWEEEL